MIGQFPWDPFPPGEPDPKGPDPVHVTAYRAAVTGADAYRSVRLALRRDSGVLRIGNRFVPDGRFREVAFVALGHAANSMALAALHVFGDRLTQGYLAGPEAVTSELPFRGVHVAPGWGGAGNAASVITAASEIAASLRESDLLLLLLSPGALRSLLLPPPGFTAEEFSDWLARSHASGASGREVGLLARTLGSGAVGGRFLAGETRGEVATFLVDRGDGATLLGGGPTHPLRAEERVEARAIAARVGTWSSLPSAERESLAPGSDFPAVSRWGASRPVLVATPSDALRAVADRLFEKGWTVRLASLDLRERPTEGAMRFLERSEELIRAEGLTVDSRTKGVATVAMTTLDLPEGPDEGPAFQEFLVRVRDGILRREMSVGLFRTSGMVGAKEYPGGAVVGAPTDPEARVPPGRARAVGMRSGITDVGVLVTGVCPTPVAKKGRAAR